MQFPGPSMFDSTLKCKLCCDKAEKKEGHCKGVIEGGSRDGAVVRALPSHQCGPGSISSLGPMWVEFVVGFRPCSKGFSPGTPVFLSP